MFWIICGSDEPGSGLVVDADHEAAVDWRLWTPGFQWDVLQEFQRNGPEVFGDDLKMAV